jgi:hypothetical protein
VLGFIFKKFQKSEQNFAQEPSKLEVDDLYQKVSISGSHLARADEYGNTICYCALGKFL